MAQKICLPRPWEAQNGFGGKSILNIASDFKVREKLITYGYINWWKSILNVASDVKVGEKLKTYEYIDLWKFGVDISNHSWVIQIWSKFIDHPIQPEVYFRHPEVQNIPLVV